jgi:hypothetical protein
MALRSKGWWGSSAAAHSLFLPPVRAFSQPTRIQFSLPCSHRKDGKTPKIGKGLLSIGEWYLQKAFADLALCVSAHVSKSARRGAPGTRFFH